ncbi:tumor necrosis factor receptor superfamily member 6-like isoform X2 [Pyxicephalus adspersus]|uniref:tumor necrosis factor receptor superfamily member 6-like isoform X2 n=1 Tax=Pyxicephalus adspersus TaxID=30357 RepID=UPI003B5A4AC6
MAPVGAAPRPVTPGLDPMAMITGTRFSLLLLMLLPCTIGLPTKTERLISENDKYYWVQHRNNQIRCLLCPAGTFVEESCTIQDTRGTCKMCPEGTYIAFASGLSECLACSRCRHDQEEIFSCSSTKNTVCRCKKGTFCPPDQPCEICMPCTTSCPEDKVIQEPCNSTSDLMCTTPGPPSGTLDILKHVIVPLVVIFVLLIIIITVYMLLKRRNHGTGSKFFVKGNKDEDAELISPLRNVTLNFKEGIDSNTKDEIIAKSCAIIVREVPIRQFEMLMLHLRVSHNEIDKAKIENPGNVNNQCNAMLQAWYQKRGFEINNLLKTLQDLHMEKAACDITEQLIRDELFVPQEQNNA